MYGWRKSYVHTSAKESLFPPLSQADDAISILRDAIKDLYRRAGADDPAWVNDDQDIFDPRRTTHGIPTLIHPGGDRPNAIRISILSFGKEYDVLKLPPSENWEHRVEELLAGLRMPVSTIRVYRGDELEGEVEVRMRGNPTEI